MRNWNEGGTGTWGVVRACLAAAMLCGPAGIASAAGAKGSERQDAYAWFNRFCIEQFSVEAEPLVYEFAGRDLKEVKGGTWVHPSRSSACVAWETNLPARTHVEYGPTAAYGRATAPSERPFHIHVHYLRGLDAGREYSYRLVSVDDRGRRLVSARRTFRTGVAAGAIEVPGALAGPPYRLTAPGATYVLTRDLSTPGTAVEIAGKGITLDLDAHTVTFACDVRGDPRHSNGIAAGKDPNARVPEVIAGVRVLNGTVVQGTCAAVEAHKSSFGANGLFLSLKDAEIAGVTVEYHAPQSWGAALWNPVGRLDVHHNVLLDRGTRIANRHGSAVRALGISQKQRGPNAFRFHHNLVKRTRQNGLSTAHEIDHNEVCVDSWSTNSFAIQPNSVPDIEAGRVHHNRVVATGFNPYALGWAHKKLKVHDNLVRMVGLDLSQRWGERWGDVNMCEGFRVTNYGKGGQVRDDLEYWHNLIVLKGRQGCELRGTGFFSDETITNLVFHDNVVKVEALDEKTIIAECIAAHGHPAKADTALPVYYRDNTLISNICHVRFGDRYGRGSNHQLIGCRFVRTGRNPQYHTFVVDGLYWCRRNVVQDCQFGPGTAYNDVFWRRTSSTSFYDVKWTLELRAPAGAPVTIRDAGGHEEFSGRVGADGVLRAALTQCRIRPPKGFRNSRPFTGCTEEPHTPHTVEAGAAGTKVTARITMDRKRALALKGGQLKELPAETRRLP